MIVERITIVGTGLLGGSLGLCIKKYGLAQEVIALVRRPEILLKCKTLGIADEVTLDPVKAASKGDMIILCTPVNTMTDIVKAMLDGIKPGTIVTDVGSTKFRLVNEITPIVESKGAFYVGAHPLAGSEKSGMDYARDDLFKGAICVITPIDKIPQSTVQLVEDFWKAVGCRIIRLSPQEHDKILARTSHLPHLVASMLVLHVLNEQLGYGQFCATGFASTTRVASGDPQMWIDIIQHNRGNILIELRYFAKLLNELSMYIEENNFQKVHEFLQTARQRREKWIEANGQFLKNK